MPQPGFLKAVRSLPEPHSWFRKSFVISFAILSLAILLNKLIPNTGRFTDAASAALQIAIALAGSFAAASLFEVFSAIRGRWQRENSIQVFRRLFGFDDKAEVAVVLPKFVPSTSSPGNGPRDASGRKMLFETALAFADVKAALEMMRVFERLDFDSPTFVWDDEASRTLEDPDPKYDAYITIGLFTNDFTTAIIRDPNGSALFDIRHNPKRFSSVLELFDRRAPLNATRETRVREYTEDETTDYAVMALTYIYGSNRSQPVPVVVIGGLSAKGTEEAGRFIEKNWSEELAFSVEPARLTSRGYAAAIKVKRGESPNATIERVVF